MIIIDIDVWHLIPFLFTFFKIFLYCCWVTSTRAIRSLRINIRIYGTITARAPICSRRREDDDGLLGVKRSGKSQQRERELNEVEV